MHTSASKTPRHSTNSYVNSIYVPSIQRQRIKNKKQQQQQLPNNMELKWDFDDGREEKKKWRTSKIADKASLKGINVNWISCILLYNVRIDWSNPAEVQISMKEFQ